MNEPVASDASTIAAPTTSHDLWATHHSSHRPIIRTIIETSSDGPVIVSTVVVGTGHSFRRGFYSVVETRVFGGKCDGIRTLTKSPGDRIERTRESIAEHMKMVERVVAAYLEA